MKGRCKQNESGEKGSGGLLLRRWMISRQIVEKLFKIYGLYSFESFEIWNKGAIFVEK
jgi:hypothetical protein